MWQYYTGYQMNWLDNLQDNIDINTNEQSNWCPNLWDSNYLITVKLKRNKC